MRRWYALSAIGRDRPGIVADVAGLIYENGCNLEDSSMTVLGGEFAAQLVFTGTGEDLDQRLSRACKHLEWEKRLTVFFRPLEGRPEPYGAGETRKRYEVEATGVDKAGIVARVARTLADRDITIEKLRTRSHREPESGTSLYTMHITMSAPAAVPAPELQRQLEHLAEDLNVEIQIRDAPAES